MARRRKVSLERLDVVGTLLAQHTDMLLVCGLGNPCWDVRSITDRDDFFYMWGGMGGATMMGFGLARAQPDRHVMVLTGDGEMLMGMGSLATVAVTKPRNLAIVVLDNEHYGETGMQTTHTHHNTELAAISKGAGLKSSCTVYNRKELEAAVPRLFAGPTSTFTCIKVTTSSGRNTLPPRHGSFVKDRFRRSVLGDANL